MLRLASFPDTVVLDVALSETFLRTATGSMEGANWAVENGADNVALHQSAIAIESLLKSYLLRTVTDDNWNRTHIRHDLDKAARYAAKAGLTLPPDLQCVISLLHPHFQRGGFQRDVARRWPGGFAADVGEVVTALAKLVA
ncbi:hypothetical protein [Mesorhizobium sp. B1-1-8]|uniref:hypothetical protein n=1 Tax=Mesorhizobium sp. B1-1-8 TaxID=2589976 RepID=UPI00112D82A8|nr:hypothetical protein [Mesorhizobium sp. B1-1-8]UCI05227.1 hypothetical protein FJ974_15290 [Mesorhizobium sp. B1-1-8]